MLKTAQGEDLTVIPSMDGKLPVDIDQLISLMRVWLYR